jgi:hypothetical protein
MTMQPADGARRTPRSAANGPQLAPRAGLSSDHRHRDGMPRRVDDAPHQRQLIDEELSQPHIPLVISMKLTPAGR